MQTSRKRRADGKPAPEAQPFVPHGEVTCHSPIFSEPLCVLEFLTLRLSPEYHDSTLPRGDGSAVVIIPGLLGMDLNLFELHAWLQRIGYRPYYSGMGFAGDCPDRLSRRLGQTIDRAYAETGRRVHLIGHSLGGIFARSAAVRRPGRIASVITLGSPFRGLVLHSLILAAEQRCARLDPEHGSGRPAGMCFEPLPLRLRKIPRAAVACFCPADCRVFEVRRDGGLAVLSEREAAHRCRGRRHAPRPAFQRYGLPAHRRSTGCFGGSNDGREVTASPIRESLSTPIRK